MSRRPRGGGALRPGRNAGAAALLAALPLLAGCASGGATASGTPLPEATAVAAELAGRLGGPEAPQRVTFTWSYADPRGPVEGEGVVRYNPPDSLRLDLFGPGDASMAVALAGDSLRTLGQVRNVRVPPAPFLHATAGIFRPGAAEPLRGFRRDGERVLVYGTGRGTRRFVFASGRLLRVEEAADGRTVRSLQLRWDDRSAWPAGAEYRDREDRSRVRWELTDAQRVDERFPSSLYDLAATP